MIDTNVLHSYVGSFGCNNLVADEVVYTKISCFLHMRINVLSHTREKQAPHSPKSGGRQLASDKQQTC